MKRNKARTSGLLCALLLILCFFCACSHPVANERDSEWYVYEEGDICLTRFPGTDRDILAPAKSENAMMLRDSPRKALRSSPSIRPGNLSDPNKARLSAEAFNKFARKIPLLGDLLSEIGEMDPFDKTMTVFLLLNALAVLLFLLYLGIRAILGLFRRDWASLCDAYNDRCRKAIGLRDETSVLQDREVFVPGEKTKKKVLRFLFTEFAVLFLLAPPLFLLAFLAEWLQDFGGWFLPLLVLSFLIVFALYWTLCYQALKGIFFVVRKLLSLRRGDRFFPRIRKTGKWGDAK